MMEEMYDDVGGMAYTPPDGYMQWKEKREKRNQEAKADAGKLPLTQVPRQIIWDIATVRVYGNHKYPKGGPDNWKQVEVERYRDAAFRHFLAYLDDPYGVDDESGLPHLYHCVTNFAFICELEKDKLLHAQEERGTLDCLIERIEAKDD